MSICVLALFVFVFGMAFGTPQSFRSPHLEFLTLGAIQPRGWLRAQLNTQAQGLASHLSLFWPNIENSTWIGGTVFDPGHLNERVPYFLNGQVVLAALVNDNLTTTQVQMYIEAILARQDVDGYFSTPDEPSDNDYWPRFPLFLALLSYAEVFPESATRVHSALLRFCTALKVRMQSRALFNWAQYRWQDLALALYRLHRVTRDDSLIELFDLVAKQQFDWESFFRSDSFPHERVTPEQESLSTHGVNVGQGLKSSAVRYLRDGDPVHRVQFAHAVALLNQYHGEASGIFSCSEHLAGRHPSQGTELCTIA
jgi:hypothetical protein